MSPAVSIIIPVFNLLPLTRNCLDALTRTIRHIPHEILLVDDGSTDGTREFIASLSSPHHRVFLNTTRQGYAANNNLAAREARAPLLVLLNNDTVPRPGWLELLLKARPRIPDIGVLGNVQWSPRTRLYDHMGIVFSPEGEPLHYGKYFPFRPHQGLTEWGAVTAACWLVSRDDFLALGGFDETFRNGCEDVDFCLRLAAKNRRHFVCNESVIDHFVSSSPDRHDHDLKNRELLKQRWAATLRDTWGVRDARRYALNYLLRFAAKPWRYNGPRLIRALASLTRPQPGSLPIFPDPANPLGHPSR